MKNMKIRTRMVVSYLIIVALLMVSGIVSIVMLTKVGDSLQSFYDNQFQTVQNALDARRLVFKVRAEVFQAIVETDEGKIKEYIQAAKDDFQELNTIIKSIDETYEGKNVKLLEEADVKSDEAESYLDQIGQYAINQQNDLAYDLMQTEYMKRMDIVRTDLDTIGSDAEDNADKKVDDGRDLSKLADVLIIVIMVVSVLIAVVLALVISESVRKPVMEMKEVSAEFASGKLDRDITYKSKDEMGEMADSLRNLSNTFRSIIGDMEYLLSSMGNGNFNITSKAKDAYVGQYRNLLDSIGSMNTSMSDTLAQIDVSADQVNSGGEQVSSGAQALAQGATEQASSVEELAATINEISHQVETTAAHAKTAKEENMQSHQEIQVCSNHMDELMKAMSAIESKSQEISRVVKSIEDIAFQTNILALNAAVEAARAGSAGKGFAVVADEVRNLATKSQEASKNTATLIEETVAAVKEGTKLSAETEASLRNVVDSAQRVLDAVTLISDATEEQSRAVAQVTQGIDQISSVVQTNSATAEQSAAASEELSGQANLLKELVSHFTLRHEGPSGMGGSSRSSSSRKSSRMDDDYSGGYAGGDKY